ncbi:hypothetical protein BC835DRAFT_1311254 [Cytidiella melzeri]|nr:hypothetical protein BC835DRAFT_1311254 [Cytidiella melzeri]
MANSEIEYILGASTLVLFFAFILYGLFCAQFYYYWMTFCDHPELKALVLFIAQSNMEAVHTGLCMHLTYMYLLTGWGDPLMLESIIWSEAVCSIFKPNYDVNCAFAVNIVLDTAITSVLVYYLHRNRCQAAKRNTKTMIHSLVKFGLTTGILTVLTSCFLFVTVRAFSDIFTMTNNSYGSRFLTWTSYITDRTYMPCGPNCQPKQV